MSDDDDRLAAELASLRIDRGDRRGERGDRPSGASEGRARQGGRSGAQSAPALILGLLLFCALGAGGYFVFREGRARVFGEEVEIGAVSLVSPEHDAVRLVATGYVYPKKRATVAPKTTGRLARLLVDEGDHVKANQIIAELESGDARAQLAQVRADIAAQRAKVDRARADIVDAQTKFDRETSLLQRGAGTKATYDEAEARLKVQHAQANAAESDVRATEARNQAAQVAMENTIVRAPFDGVVVRKLTEVGEIMSVSAVGGVGVVTIASLDDLEVQADVSETQVHKVTVGGPAEILLDAFPDRRFRGRVSEIRQTVDRAKAAVTVKVKFTDEARGVLPDMAAKVSFLERPLDDAALKAAPKLVAPADAVVNRDGQPTLFVVVEDRVRAERVQLGARIGDQIELTSGPSTGTRVVRRPSPELQDGLPVKEKKR
jgi:RND family efflux transporter MFP subunit